MVGRLEAHGKDKGGGFLLAYAGRSSTRIVLTANHVIDGSDDVLVFVAQDGKRVGVERTERDPTLDIAVLHLSEDIDGGLHAQVGLEGAEWKADSRPNSNDPRLTGTITDTARTINNAKGHEVCVLQLHVQEALDSYKGYSGSPIVSSSGAVLGILVEEVPSRMATISLGQPKPASNVLYAIPMRTVLDRFGLMSVLAPSSHQEHIEEMLRVTYSECTAHWQALGVPRYVAQDMAHEQMRGRFSHDLLPDSSDPLSIVTGDFGAGKSLGCIRYYQQSLHAFVASTAQPIPVLLGSTELSGNLSEDILRKCLDLGDPKKQGARVAIDIIDEGIDLRALLNTTLA